MSTITIGTQLYNVIYVDPSIATADDGSTPALALDNIPAPASLVTNTCYLIRRTDTANVCSFTTGTTPSNLNVVMIGMPKTTDKIYASIPAEAKTAWDSDGEDFAQMYSTGKMTIPTINYFGLYRLRCSRADGITATDYMFNFSTSPKGDWSVDKCKFTHDDGDLADRAGGDAVVNDRYQYYIYSYNVRNYSFTNSEINHCTGTNSSRRGLYCTRTINNVIFSNNTLHIGSGHYDGFVVQLSAEQYVYAKNLFCFNNNFIAYKNNNSSYSDYMPQAMHAAHFTNIYIKGINYSYGADLTALTLETRLRRQMFHIGTTNTYSINVSNIIINVPELCYCSGL